MSFLSVNEFSELLRLLPSINVHEPWTPFLQKVADLTGSETIGLVAHDLRTGAAAGFCEGYEPQELARYFECYSRLNPWMPKTVPVLAAGGSVTSSESILPLNKLKQTQFYNDWGYKNYTVFSLGASLGIQNGCFRYLALSRSEKSGPHSEGASKLLLLLIPHIQNVLRVQQKIAHLEDLRRVLDSVSLPVFLLDRDCRVVEMTSSAQAFRSQLTLLSRQGGKLRDEIAAFSVARDVPFKLLRIARDLSGKYWDAVVIRASALSLTAAPKYLFVILDPIPSEEGAFREAGMLYGLTTAETRFVRTLVSTGSRDLARNILGIAQNTAKTHLASIFNKTGTTRQGQVIQLFSLLGRLAQVGEDI